MTNIKPRRLLVSGFRSFSNQVEVDLPEQGLVLITGRNHDSGGRSGSGKSSFLEALAYAFDISQFPATEHQSWYTEAPFQVELELDTPVGTTLLRRGKVNSIKIGDQKAVSGAAAAKNKLQSIIGLKSDMLRALTYRPQRERGLFLSMGDTAKKEFLTELLHLGRFETEAEKTQKEISKLERDVEVEISLATRLTDSLPVEPVCPDPLDISPLVQKQTALEFEYDAVRTRLAEATEQLKKIEIKLGEERLIVEAEYSSNQPLPANSTPLRNKLKIIQAAIEQAKASHFQSIDKMNMEWMSMKSLLDGAKALVAESLKEGVKADALRAELELLQANTCSTCKQKWATPATVKAIEERKNTLAGLEASISNAALYRQQIPTVEKQLKDLNDRIFAKKQEQVALDLREVESKLYEAITNTEKEASKALAEHRLQREQALGKIQTDYQQMLDSQRKKVTALTVEVAKAKEAVADSDFQIKQAKQQASFQAQEFERAREVYNKALQQKTDAQTALARLQASVNQEKDYLGAVGREGFLGLIFGDVLDAIAAETNQILAKVPNVAHITLQFQTERETQEGKIRKEIKPFIYSNGREVSLRSGLSGGMQAAVELAVDIAVSKVVSERTGVFPGWLVLDEAFDGLGVVEKRGCMEVLAQAAQDRLILVVDHASEIQELFDQVIMIECRGGVSAIV